MAAATRRLEVLQCHLGPLDAIVNAPGSSAVSLAQQPCSVAAASEAAAAAAAGPVVLVGGMVMDLQAHPTGPADVQRGGSVPGRVTQSAGGVARNVGEALALLLKSGGAAPAQLPLLVSAVGDDLAGQALLQHWQSLGLSTACISTLPGGATPSVSVVFDLAGEVTACVADVALLERQLVPCLLRTPRVTAALAAAPVVMLDGNLGEAALEEACRQAGAAGVPVWFEPVSVPKSTRATSRLASLAYASPNEKELAAMAAAARQQQQQQQQQHSSCGCGSSSSSCKCASSGCCGRRCLCTRSGCSGSQCTGSGSSGSQCTGSGCSGCKCAGSGSSGCKRTGSSCSGCKCTGSGCKCTGICCCATAAAAAAAGHGKQQLGSQAAGPAAALRSMLPDIATLLLAGLRHLVLTLGADGAALCTLAPGRQAVEVCHVPALPAKVANCSGAGDCLVAGCLFGLAQGLPAASALCYGVAAARAAVESQTNVPAGLNAAAVQAEAAAAHARSSIMRLALPRCGSCGSCCCGAGRGGCCLIGGTTPDFL